jgi:diguanylate cyclase (GGDEF)-like protein
VDLNKFKPINDNYGHDVGDRVLIEAAQRLLSAVREEDTVARLGGDEFVVLLSGLNSESEAENAVKRLLKSLNQPMKLVGRIIDIEGSIGYVLYPNDSTDAKRLIELADRSMYEAKSKEETLIKRYTNI